MRYIEKTIEQPAVITDFIKRQMDGRAADGDPAAWKRLGVDYTSFGGGVILPLLISEQHGLCAYTGVGIDDRLDKRQPRRLAPPRDDYWFKPQVEHLKSQAQCRAELEAQGLVPEKDPGEDMDYHSMVAALEVAGTRSEWFGASHRENNPFTVWPTHAGCESRFRYSRDNGAMEGVDEDAQSTVDTLLLNHFTLRSWRKGWIDGFLDPEVIVSREDYEAIIHIMNQIVGGKMEEFCFVVKAVAQAELSLIGEV